MSDDSRGEAPPYPIRSSHFTLVVGLLFLGLFTMRAVNGDLDFLSWVFLVFGLADIGLWLRRQALVREQRGA